MPIAERHYVLRLVGFWRKLVDKYHFHFFQPVFWAYLGIETEHNEETICFCFNLLPFRIGALH